MKLTKAQIEVLCWARKTGHVFPFKRRDGGGSRHRMAARMVTDGLLAMPFGLTITDVGLKAIESFDDYGNRKSRMTPEALKAIANGSLKGHRGKFSLTTGQPVK